MDSGNIAINRAFFGNQNCLKIMLNANKECYMHWGKKENEKYKWYKIKFQDTELGQIYDVLDGKLPQVSFYHTFNGNKRQVWIRKVEGNGAAFFKIDEMTKSLSAGEIIVMKMLIVHIIVLMNLS